jgi:phosphoglycerate dehydrogenase-like enzyme
VITVTLPTAEDCAAFGPVPDGVRLVPWDLSGEPDSPDDIAGVLIPPYFFDRDGFARLHKLPNLRLVQLPSAGVEHAMKYLPDVEVANGRGVHDDETAELAIGLTIASLRGIDVAVRDKELERWTVVTRPSLADRRVLLIGHGSIGAEIAARLATFKVDLTIVARTARAGVHGFDELPALLPAAEVVILILPLTDETREMVNADFLAALPDGALVVNVARGRIVDTDALLAELTSRRLFAALDVTHPEPLPTGHPLWRAPNLIITPHVGGNTTATSPRVLALMRRQVTALAAGEPRENVV